MNLNKRMNAAIPKESGLPWKHSLWHMSEAYLHQHSFAEGSGGIMRWQWATNQIAGEELGAGAKKMCGIRGGLGVPKAEGAAIALEGVSEILQSRKDYRQGITWWIGLSRWGWCQVQPEWFLVLKLNWSERIKCGKHRP